MLRNCALCLLLALAALPAPIAAQADSPPQPIPADGKCAVPVDPDWTKQEQFVWLNVCVGKEADFNKEPGYGDDLDPKSPAGLPKSRILRSSFLETILLKDKYRGALTRLGVRIIGARFTKKVDLRNAKLEHDLWLVRSLLERGIDLTTAETSRPIEFDDSKIDGLFDATKSQVNKDLSMNRVEFSSYVELFAAHIGGQLLMSGSTVKGLLNMNGIRVDQDLFMNDNAQFNGIDLTAAHIGGVLNLSGSTVKGVLHMNMIRVDQTLFMLDEAHFTKINLVAAHISGQLILIGSTVTGKLNMNGIHVDQNLLMHDKAQFNEIGLTGAHIGGQLTLAGSTVTGMLDMNEIRIDQSLFMYDKAQFNEIDLTAAHIGGLLDLSSSTAWGKLEGQHIQVEGTVFLGNSSFFADEVDLTSAKLGQDFDLSRGSFYKNVNLSGTQIGGVLGLESTELLGSATLNLTDAAVGEINLSPNWPAKVDPNGLTYRNLSNISKNTSQQTEIWFGTQKLYAPQPYQQLASVLQANGRITDATAIRYAGKEQELKTTPCGLYEVWTPCGRYKAWLVLLDWSIGFGYHLEYAFYWAVGFVLLGWAVLYATGQRTKHGITLGLTYSFDMLLPLVQLNKKHYDINLDPWPQRYFYAHKIIGVILTSFIVAGISGLTK